MNETYVTLWGNIATDPKSMSTAERRADHQVPAGLHGQPAGRADRGVRRRGDDLVLRVVLA